MSTKSRYRKAICRISRLYKLPEYMIQKPLRIYANTWKKEYKFTRKIEQRFNSKTKRRTLYGKEEYLPLKYKEGLKLFAMWNIDLTSYAYKSKYFKKDGRTGKTHKIKTVCRDR